MEDSLQRSPVRSPDEHLQRVAVVVLAFLRAGDSAEFVLKDVIHQGLCVVVVSVGMGLIRIDAFPILDHTTEHYKGRAGLIAISSVGQTGGCCYYHSLCC